MSDPANMITAIGTLLTGAGTFGTAFWTRRVHRQVKPANGSSSTLAEQVEQVREEVTTPPGSAPLGELAVAVREEVQTANGIPMGEMADRAEGRRIAELEPETRTPSEQSYVDRLDAGGRDR